VEDECEGEGECEGKGEDEGEGKDECEGECEGEGEWNRSRHRLHIWSGSCADSCTFVCPLLRVDTCSAAALVAVDTADTCR
jgi:hypothetical protein